MCIIQFILHIHRIMFTIRFKFNDLYNIAVALYDLKGSNGSSLKEVGT